MSERSNASRRRMVGLSTASVGVLLALALLLIVNYFGWKYHTRFDWTGSQLYTLSEKSLNILGDLDRDVEAVVFLSPGDELYDPVMELLARYEAASPRVSVRTLDVEKNPAEAQSLVDKYEITQLNVVVLDSGDDRRVVEGADLAEYDFSGMQFGQGPRLEKFKGEQVFTSAILELAESRKPKILFTTGHGELGVDDATSRGLTSARDLLGRDNFEMEGWASLGQPRVPEGTDLVVIAGPRAGFVEPEVAALRAYLEEGGRLLALLDPVLDAAGALSGTGLEPLLAEYGVVVGQDLVVDPGNPLPFYGAETIFVSSYEEHPITRSLRQTQVPVIFPLARSVQAGDALAEAAVSELLKTTAEGWGEVDLSNLDGVEQGEGDVEGPVPLGVAVAVESAVAGDEGAAEAEDGEASRNGDGDEAPDAGSEDSGETAESGSEDGSEPTGAEATAGARLVVFGDSDFASNGQLPNVGNAELLVNTMNWLVERETLLGIPPKEPEQVRLSLTGSELRLVSWLVFAILPGLAVVSGVLVYFRRRR